MMNALMKLRSIPSVTGRQRPLVERCGRPEQPHRRGDRPDGYRAQAEAIPVPVDAVLPARVRVEIEDVVASVELEVAHDQDRDPGAKDALKTVAKDVPW